MSRDIALAEKFRDAIVQGPEAQSAHDSVLRAFSLHQLLALPNLADLSPLERLVFCTPFLTLLYPSASNVSDAKRSIAIEAATQIHSVLLPALEQLGKLATTAADLAELSPLSISKLFSILLSDLSIPSPPTGAIDQDVDSVAQVFNEEERRAIVMAAVRGRLGSEVGSQALTHALGEMEFDSVTPPSPIAILSRLSPVLSLCSPDLVRAVLVRFGNLGSADATDGQGGAELRVSAMLFELVDLAMRDAELVSSIDLSNWVRGIHDLQPALRWGDVVRAYDNPLRTLPETWGLRLFAALLPLSPFPADSTTTTTLSAMSLYSAPGGTSAISGLWSPWANPLLQFNLIEKLVYLPAETFNLSTLPSIHKVVSLDDAARASPTIKTLALAAQGTTWNCRELVATLVRLGESNGGMELTSRVHDMLDRACKSNPELVLIALVQIEVISFLSRLLLPVADPPIDPQKPWNALHNELTARLLSVFLTGHPSHQLVFLRIYQADRQFLTAALRDFYAESEINVSRILDVAQDLKILDLVLELRPFFLALDLAALASRREYLNLDKWLASSIAALGGVFVRATLEFVGHKVRHDLVRQELDPPPEPTTLTLSAVTVALFMKALRLQSVLFFLISFSTDIFRCSHELFTGNDVELFKEVRTQCLQLYPRLMNFSPGNVDNEAGMAVVTFSPEIEAEVDASYQKMYDQVSHSLPVALRPMLMQLAKRKFRSRMSSLDCNEQRRPTISTIINSSPASSTVSSRSIDSSTRTLQSNSLSPPVFLEISFNINSSTSSRLESPSDTFSTLFAIRPIRIGSASVFRRSQDSNLDFRNGRNSLIRFSPSRTYKKLIPTSPTSLERHCKRGREEEASSCPKRSMLR